MKNIIFLTTLLFIFYTSSFSQTWLEDQAEDLYNSRDYVHAIPVYEKLAKMKKNTPYLYKLGMCYYHLKDYFNAQKNLELIKDRKDAPLEAILYDAFADHYLGMYNAAKENYILFESKGGNYPNLQILKKSCDYALERKDSINLKFIIDTAKIAIDGLYLGGAWHNGKLVYSEPDHTHDKIKKTVYPNYKISEIDGEVVNENGEPLFHQFYTGGLCYSKDGRTVYFTRNESDEKFIKKKHYTKNNIGQSGINTLGIYKAAVDHQKWSNIEHLNFNDINHSCMHPSITEDGSKLFFSSNREGGFGGYDIYYVTWAGSNWSEPINCGEKVNTVLDEMFPYIINDSVLYFSSNGHLGFGAADIYYSLKSENKWNTPINIGKPINTSMDDFAFIFGENNQTGFWGSNIIAAPGKDHVFKFKIRPNFIKGKGVVLDKLTLKPIPNAHVKIHVHDSIIELIADDNGKFQWDYFEDHEHYHIEFSAEKYEAEVMDFDADTSITLHLDKNLEPHIEKNMVFTFNDILFEYNKADLLPDSKLILDRLAEVLIHSNATVELSAHTDARGSDKYNLTLSQKRALSAVNYLIEKGVPISNVIGKGYGETKLKNSCINGAKCSEEEHTVNRRVEIKILDVKE